MKTKTFKVSGMTCQGCERSIEAAMMAVDGVGSAVANYDGGTVRLELEILVASSSSLQTQPHDASSAHRSWRPKPVR